MARRIHLLTTNDKKFAEYKKRLSQYGVEVVQSSRDAGPNTIPDLLGQEGVIAVARERSNLFGADAEVIKERIHLQVVTNRTTLVVHTLKDGEPHRDVYVREIEGHIDLRRRLEDRDVFSWDDVFVPRQTLRSYHEMRELGLKLSARDLVIADYVRDHLWYKRGFIRLNWSPLKNKRSVDFGVAPERFIAQHPVYGTLPSRHPLRNILDHTIAEGLFFRAAKNRREKNYWMPGLNAGVPLVPKRDNVHEATFMFHDLMHFAFPDLIFDGASDRRGRNVYAVHRMMSEAFTLVLADMLFVDELKTQGLDYDFSKRRIHPLFASMGIDVQDPDALRALLWANVSYCLRGDRRPYEALGASSAALDGFCQKYEQFFVSDWRWTCQNHRSMSARDAMPWRSWLETIAPIRQALPFETPTISETVEGLERCPGQLDFGDLEGLVAAIFESYWARLVALMSQPPKAGQTNLCLKHGFMRYMMGQLAMCSTYSFMEEGTYFARSIQEALSEMDDSVTLEEVRALRGFFDQFVDLLWDQKVVSDDDRDVFKEVYPIFEPFYVEYDVEVTTALEAVARDSILGLHRNRGVS